MTALRLHCNGPGKIEKRIATAERAMKDMFCRSEDHLHLHCNGDTTDGKPKNEFEHNFLFPIFRAANTIDNLNRIFICCCSVQKQNVLTNTIKNFNSMLIFSWTCLTCELFFKSCWSHVCAWWWWHHWLHSKKNMTMIFWFPFSELQTVNDLNRISDHCNAKV